MARTESPPPVARPPASPRAAARPAAALDPDIDPDFPDVDSVDIDGVELTFPDARTLTVLRSTLRECRVDPDTEAALDATDTTFIDGDLTARTIESLSRVVVSRCRVSGADFGDARLPDVCFDDCILDLASMRGAQLERVLIRGGRVDGLDLSGARLRDVVFVDVSLAGVSFDGARLEKVDVTGADLAGLPDIGALRGATIGEGQAVSLSIRLAKAAGIDVARPA